MIRPERPGDEEAIRTLTERAFAGHPHSDGNEANVIERLRGDGDLLASLVALEGTRLVGQITFSRAILANADDDWAVLGPVAVDPAYHGMGIGRALIESGEAAIAGLGIKGVTVLGDPAFYVRFGYAQHTPLRLEGELGDYLQVKSFGAPIPETTISFAPAFG